LGKCTAGFFFCRELQTTPPHRRLLLIGWDAADWDVITPLMEAGRMPHLARMVKEGVSGNLASLRPCLTPLLWTTIVTGHTADRHGILGFAEPLPDKSGIVASRSTTRRVPALWNMLGARGRRCCVVTWPVSNPPEPIPGVYVSAGILETLADRPDAIAFPPPGLVHPPEATHLLNDWRFHPCELAVTDLMPFVPDVEQVNPAADRRPEILARHYARAATSHAIATGLMEQERWDLCAVYYETLDRTGHDFMAYRAPLRPGVPAEEAQRYGGVVDAMYEFHDAMLGRLLELAGPDTCVCVLSDHGFQSGAGRPAYRPHKGAGVAEDGADWHRMMGMIVLHGPGLRRGARIHGATLPDVLPTLLTWLGLPVGQDMTGGVMLRAFDPAPEVAKIPSWDALCLTEKTGNPPRLEDARGHFGVLRQLSALGYLAEDALSGETAVLHCLREAQFNLAIVHLHAARPTAALTLLHELCAERPLDARCELARLEALRAAENHHEALAQLARCEAAGLGGPAFDLAAAASLYSTNQPEAAEERLERARAAQPDNPDILVTAGRMAQLRQQRDAAERWFRRALELEPAHAAAHGGMAGVMLENGAPEAALEHAVTGLRRYFFNPELHWVLAQALYRMGERDRAIDACRHALIQAPSLRAAGNALAAWTSDRSVAL
jgi:tetratricopeptide (TPR) repeat protein